MESRPHRRALRRKSFAQRLAVPTVQAKAQHTCLCPILRGIEHLRTGNIPQQCRHMSRQVSLVPCNTSHALLLHKSQALQKSCNPRHIVRPCLQPVRQLLRHLLQDRLRPRAAPQQWLRLRAAQQQPRALRPVQSFMPRHGDKRRAQRIHVYRQHPRRLRRIQHEWHTLLPTQRRDALYRQSEAKHVGHVCADHRVRRTRQRSGELPYHLLPIKQRPIRYRQLHAGDSVQRPGNGVVLIPRNDHPSAGLHQRMHGNVQPMCSAGGEHHSRRISHAKQLCCQCAALQVCFLRRPRGRITPPPRRG